MTWNQHFFLALNAPAYPPPLIEWMAEIAANWLIFLVPATLIFLWIRGPAVHRSALLSVAAAIPLGQALNQVAGMLWIEPRPFMAGIGHTLLPHLSDNSFPSDHVTLLWTAGLGLILGGASKASGAVICLCGIVVAWARIYLGLHFPIDMVGSMAISLLAATAARQMRGVFGGAVLHAVEGIYEILIRGMRLPMAIFPRKEAKCSN